MNRIGEMCDFDVMKCQTCPSGYTNVGRNMSSCGTCEQRSQGIVRNGVYVSRMTLPYSYVIFNRNDVLDKFSTGVFNLPEGNTQSIPEMWWDTDQDMVFVRIPELFGFFSYSLSGDNTSIRLSRTKDNRSLYNVISNSLIQSQVRLELRISNGNLEWNNTVLQLEN